MNIHVALYKWKAGASESEINQVLADIEALANKIPGIEITTARNSSQYSEGYTHVIFIRGETQSAIDAYRVHPDHIKAARQIESIEEQGIGVDFETS